MARAEREQVDSSVALLIGLVTAGTAAVTVGTASTTAAVVAQRPLDFVVFLVLALALQLFAIEVVGGGRIGVSAATAAGATAHAATSAHSRRALRVTSSA